MLHLGVRPEDFHVEDAFLKMSEESAISADIKISETNFIYLKETEQVIFN